jgi:hypothetical protein
MNRFPSKSLTTRRRTAGSVLVITLFVALLLGMVLTSYLLLIRAQSVSVARSQAWHAALTAAEAGVEEALAQLNITPLTTNLTFDLAWRPELDGYVLDQPRNLNASPDANGTSYSVRILSGVPPLASAVIYATGYATVPAVSATLTRTLEVVTTNAALFSVGLVVHKDINLNGYDFMADSYDSDSELTSDSGKYNPAKRKQNGDVASTLGILNAASVDIRGRLFQGSTAPIVPAPEFEVFSDFNAEFPEVSVPVLAGSAIAPGTNSSYDYWLDKAQYQAPGLHGSVGVKAGIHTVLYVTGDVNITNLWIGDNASLKLYVGGGNTSLGPMDVAASASAFQYYGLPANTNVTLMKTTNFVGTLYAPNARLTAAGGTEPLEFEGALVVKSADLFKPLSLHYDENLQRSPVNGPLRGFIVTGWREL